MNESHKLYTFVSQHLIEYIPKYICNIYFVYIYESTYIGPLCLRQTAFTILNAESPCFA